MTDKDPRKYELIHGNVFDVKAASFERVVIYVCVTIAVVTWLIVR